MATLRRGADEGALNELDACTADAGCACGAGASSSTRYRLAWPATAVTAGDALTGSLAFGGWPSAAEFTADEEEDEDDDDDELAAAAVAVAAAGAAAAAAICAVCISTSHMGLCLFQSATWHARPQYHACLQREHRCAAICAQTPHTGSSSTSS